MSFTEPRFRPKHWFKRWDPACEGPGQCHGCLNWCNVCGDVGTTCSDKPNCDTHRECEHGVNIQDRGNDYAECVPCDVADQLEENRRWGSSPSQATQINEDAREP
jgi:hypothetical protein